MISAASAQHHNGMMDPNLMPVKRGPGRPRKIQPPIDPSLPLHPWASTHRAQQQKQEMLAAAAAAAAAPGLPSSLYRPPQKTQPRPPTQAQQLPLQQQQQQLQQLQQLQQQQQYATSKQLPPFGPAAAAPVSASSFYAQPSPAYHNDFAYATATPAAVATPEPQFFAPASALPKKKLLSRADLDFLLGGSSKARARSSTPNNAAVLDRQTSKAPAALQPTSAAHRSAGPSGSSASMRGAHSAQSAQSLAQASGSRMPMGEDADTSGDIHDDDLPLGAEAVMESDHETSFEADIEDTDAQNDRDDPNDRDFRLYDRSTSSKRLPRLSDLSGDGAAGGTGSVKDAVPSGKPKRGRPSQASLASAAGKVPGSDILPKRKRGRPSKDLYTPEVIAHIKAANSILGVDLPGPQRKMPRLDQIIDRKTRKAMSPEMRQALLRARNTQLQRERRERLRKEHAEAEMLEGQGNVVPKEEPVDRLLPDKPDTEERGRRSKRRERGDDDMETGSGSAILERAKGKVSEWIRTIPSEAEMSVESDGPNQVEPDAPARSSQLRRGSDSSPTSSAKQRPIGMTPLLAPAAENASIDPRLAAEHNDDELVQGYFSRFGTVTGAANPVSKDKEAGHTDMEATKDGTRTYEAGVAGDEYYFSN